MSEPTNVFSGDILREISEKYGTPVYVYSEESLISQANEALSFPRDEEQDFRVRFAMKACPNAAILQIFHRAGLHFDASSGYEVTRALRAGIPAERISLSTQEFPSNFTDLISEGIEFNACSLHQLEKFGKLFPGSSCGIRFNPGLGSGGTEKTNVGGPAASFGIWHSEKDIVKSIADQYGVTVKRIHTHIGSGSDPDVWIKAASMSLALVEFFSGVTALNLGGGFKVARIQAEHSADLKLIGQPIKELIQSYCARTNRTLQFEIEPGTFLTANCGALLTRVQDITSTGKDGYNFLKIDSGMTEILRPCLYGGQHPITIHKRKREKTSEEVKSDETHDYIVVGHCCESGDLLTCAPGEPDRLYARTFDNVEIDDLLVIGGSGAYCSSMNAKNYNSFPEAAEVLVDNSGTCHLIRRRQTMDQILANEVEYNPV